jgi:hypothetical protein
LITVGNGGKLALKAKSGRAQKSYLSNVWKMGGFWIDWKPTLI